MHVNGHNIDPTNVNEFEKILSKIPPPINIEIRHSFQNDDHKSIGNDTQTPIIQPVQLIIHYKDAAMSYELNNHKNSWNDNTYNDLYEEIKTHFKIDGTIEIKNEANKYELEDIDDIRDEYEKYEKDPNFNALHLNIHVFGSQKLQYQSKEDTTNNTSILSKPLQNRIVTLQNHINSCKIMQTPAKSSKII